VLGSLIRKLRVRLPHFAKAAKFASQVGCTREHYRRIEAGTGFPSKVLMQKVINHLEVSQDQADGLWVAWGMQQIPSEVREGVVIITHATPGLVSRALLGELDLMYDLSTEDREDLEGVITATINKEEVPWRD
jgi:hypothetical protein